MVVDAGLPRERRRSPPGPSSARRAGRQADQSRHTVPASAYPCAYDGHGGRRHPAVDPADAAPFSRRGHMPSGRWVLLWMRRRQGPWRSGSGGWTRQRSGRCATGAGAAWVTVARAASALAEPAFCGPLLAACAVTTASRVGWRRACAPCLVVASGAAARRALSKAVARPRPPADAWLTQSEGFSLPSKHTTLAALTAGACAGSLGAGGAVRYGLPLLAAAGAGASRVYLGVHWPSDILAAWMFAEGWLRLCESVPPASGGHSRTGFQ